MEQKQRRWFSNLLLLLCAAIFCFSAWKLTGYLTEYKRGEQEYSELSSAFMEEEPKAGKGDKKSEEKEQYPKVDFQKLLEVNEEVVGWIVIEDTAVNYPIVQGRDNDYYLHHTVRRKPNQGGAIFMDAGNQADFSSYNTILYGHNLKTGKMFGSLRYYEDKKYWKEHPHIWLLTPQKSMKYQIFSSYTTEAFGEAYTLDFTGPQDFSSYLTRCVRASYYDMGVAVGSDDSILTLSTCTSDAEDGRRVVQAKRIYEEENGDG